MGNKRILAILGIIFALLFFTSSQVSAFTEQPYIGGYLYLTTRVTTSKVLLKVNFEDTVASEIPPYKWLGGLTSVAGANGVTPSGWTHQNGVALYSDNDVYWAPQGWQGGGEKPKYSWSIKVFGSDAGDYEAFYLRTNIDSGTLNSKLYVYRNQDDIGRDRPYITYIWNHATTDSNFLVGTSYYNNFLVKFFQFGVESNMAITETYWEVLNDKVSFYYEPSAIWLYTGARVCLGGACSANTWYEGIVYEVGGIPYPGVNTKYKGNDQVCWKYVETPIPDGSWLWYTWGQPSREVSDPWE